MPRRSYRSYTTEFKLAAVQAYRNGQAGLKAVAKQYGICHTLLIRWVRKFEQGDLNEELAEAHTLRDYEAKIATLERKVGQLVMELDLLKKGAPRQPTGEPVSIVSGPQVCPFPKDAA
jgi:transposase